MRERADFGSLVRGLFSVGLLGMLACGCKTYQQQNKAIVYWRQGNVAAAAAEAGRMAEKNAGNKDAVIWRLEEGAALRANRQYNASNKAFNIAQEKIDQYAREARIKLGHEAGALLSNQANLPYEGRAYDGIMLNTYEALNYLALGQPDNARPELIRAYQRQQDAVEDNKRRIEKVQDEAARQPNPAALKKAEQDPAFQAALQTDYGNLENLKPYANYVNPFTVYLDGLYFMANATDGSDLERARKSFERVRGFLGDNDYIRRDLAAVDARMSGKPFAPTTYVIFETGCAPRLRQVRIDIPIIVSRVSYVGAAFPVLEFQGDYVPSLTVTAGGSNTPTVLLASMDSVIGLDFKNQLPIIITKTIASTIAKAGAGYGINYAARKQNDIAGLIAQIGTAVYQAAVNIADTRTWTTLPKEFQFCRVPTPPDRSLILSTPSGSKKTPVTVGDGTLNLVYVKSINTETPLLVTQMKLK